MIFTKEGTYLLSLIQRKADAKLLKQQILYVFWWYFISGASGWNFTFLIIFALPIFTPNIWNVFLSSPLNLVWYSFLIEIWFMCHGFSFKKSWSISNQRLDLAECTWKLYFFVFYFYSLSSDYLRWIITTCACNPFSIAIFKTALNPYRMFWGSFELFLHWFKFVLEKKDT